MPWWLERACLLLAGIWFVNLVNFMDGIDWMTVAEVVPVTAALAAFGLAGALPPGATVVATGAVRRDDRLCAVQPPGGAAVSRRRRQPADRSAARLGCWSCWPAAAIWPPRCCCRSTIWPTRPSRCCRRLVSASRSWQAHRSHFYQRAKDRGFSVYQIVGRVFAVNVVLDGACDTLFAPLAALSNNKFAHWHCCGQRFALEFQCR